MQYSIPRSTPIALSPSSGMKVYGLFSVAIGVTAIGVYLGSMYAQTLFTGGTHLILLIAELAIIFTARLWERKSPLNVILFCAFPLISGITIAPYLWYVSKTYTNGKETGRKFIIDLHSAELFDRLKSYSADIPQSSHPDILLWYPKFQREYLRDHGLGWLMIKHRPWKKTLKDFSSEIPKSIMMLRPYFRTEIDKNADLSGSVWVYSMWKGYLGRKKSLQDLKQWTEGKGIPFKFLHTTGHAQLQDLKRLAKALSPHVLIPIHSYHCELFSEHFENVHRLEDGEVLTL
jgi:hypothetical protein